MQSYTEKFSSSGNFILGGGRYEYENTISNVDRIDTTTNIIYPANTSISILIGYYNDQGTFISTHKRDSYELIFK